LKLFDCPDWKSDENSALPDIAQGASAFVRFSNRQNPKRYILTHGDIKEWHKKLFLKTVPVPYYAGNFRSIDPAKPCLNTPVYVNGVPGAPAAEVAEQMKRFSDELGRATKSTDEYLTSERSPVERYQAAAQLAAFAGGKIIQIHPFRNGNGRMARMVMNFFLLRYLNYAPFYIDRPKHPAYAPASQIAMQYGVVIPLYQYLLELIALEA
jgi:fido (protein-threonine AMPylation protein)